MSAELLQVADAVCEAVRRHAAALVEGTGDRHAAGVDLSTTLQRYGLTLNGVGVVPPDGLNDFAPWLDEEDEVEHQDETEPDSSRHKIGCFLRVDLGVGGEPSTELCDAVSEGLQNLLQDHLLDHQSEFELEGMTCRVLGPLSDEDELSEALPGQEFRPLCENLMSDEKYDEE